jgi:2-polyprenyl-6-methoxyphenol hydroxylase-like FAD-dependent oxidoreductase
MKHLTIAVAGAGVAGLASALFLHRQGHRVVVVDQMDQPRPVGSGLMMQPTGLAVMDALGLGAELRRLGRPIERMFGLLMPSGRTVLDVAYDPAGRGRNGLAVHRAALFGTLRGAVEREGIEMRPRQKIAALDGGERQWLITESGARLGPFDLVVDGLGARSPLAPGGRRVLPYGALWATVREPEATFHADRLEQRYVGAHRMVGVLPVGQVEHDGARHMAFFWSLRADGHEAWLQRGLEAWKDDVRILWPETDAVLEQIGSVDELVMARYTHFTDRNPVERGLVRLGDSAHTTSPQLGQGANMALLDAAALALALEAEPDLARALAAYRDSRRWHVSLYQFISAVFTPFYQSDSRLLAWMRDNVLWPLSRVPPGPALLSLLARGELLPALHGVPPLADLFADRRYQDVLLSQPAPA